jgi:hypothetical protein
MNENQKIQWQPIIELSILLFTTLGTTIPLYLHTDAKQQAYQERCQATLDGIREDMRDFHTRLCLIEERNRGK